MSQPGIKIAFFGTPKFVVPVLTKLETSDFKINLVITQPDKPQNRSKQALPSPVKTTALKLKLPVLTPERITSDFIKKFSEQKINLAIVAAYGLILPKEIIDLPKFGFLNIHPSLLPKYRGASPLQAALLNKETKTGITIMKMDEKMDHGPILAQQKLIIKPTDTIQTLLPLAFERGAELLLKILPDYLTNRLKSREQIHSQATFTKLIKKDQGKIDWSKSSLDIKNLTRAYLGWPGSFTFFQNKKLEIISCAIYSKSEKNNTPGKVYKKDQKIIVECGCGNLELKLVKLAGKKEMSINDFVHGHKNFIGSILN